MTDAAGLEARLRRILDERYHHRHPFNVRLHGGQCTPEEVRRWVRNRYYYQTRIPLKDGLSRTKSEDREFRRGWIRRIHDHDGDDARAGGIELWLRLAEAAGLARDEVASLRNVLPGVRRACDAYVEFVGSHDLLASVASSLTELSAGPFLGARAEAGPDWLRVEPGPLSGAEIETYDDHRIAMSFALAGLRVPGVIIRDPGCVSKTWPNFFDIFGHL